MISESLRQTYHKKRFFSRLQAYFCMVSTLQKYIFRGYTEIVKNKEAKKGIMAIEDYQKAQKAGVKEYDNCVSHGQHPYLANLDDMTAQVDVEARIKLGLVDIPVDQIVGTYQEARSNAFARNFMPLLDKDSEFAHKWAHLYDSLEEEGLRDPIVAYEFLGKYYVQEGNKRVSVSRYMGAVTIEGTITRIIPKRNDSPEIQIYYEYLDFYEKSQLNYLPFSKPGSYALLRKALSDDPDVVWDDDMRMDFRSAYACFKKEYLANGGAKLSISTADAFLIYLTVFGYAHAKESLAADFRSDIAKLWEDFQIYSRNHASSISLHPIEDPKKHMLSFLTPSKSYKAAWIYSKNPETSGWTYSHELGREYVSGLFDKQCPTEAFYDVDPANAEETLKEIIAKGYNIIFATSPQFLTVCAKVALDNPGVKVLNCSLNTSYRHVRSYYLRTYEAKFVIGAMAGALTKNNKIGYLADYPIYGSAASINAFTMGALLTNPDAEVYLEWSTLKDHDPMEAFAKEDITIISSRDMHPTNRVSREYGLYQMDVSSPVNIAVPIWHWGKLYEELIRSILNGNWKDEEEDAGMHSLSYWWGMSAGAIDVIHSEKLPTGTIRLAEILRGAIASGLYNPFCGELRFLDDTTLGCGQGLAPEEIMKMNKLICHVHGFLPGIEDLREEFRPLLTQQGLFRPETETQK